MYYANNAAAVELKAERLEREFDNDWRRARGCAFLACILTARSVGQYRGVKQGIIGLSSRVSEVSLSPTRRSAVGSAQAIQNTTYTLPELGDRRPIPLPIHSIALDNNRSLLRRTSIMLLLGFRLYRSPFPQSPINTRTHNPMNLFKMYS